MNPWAYLSGKKRNIALAYWMIIVPIITLWPDSWGNLPEAVVDGCALLGIIMSGLGLGHAYVKSKNGHECKGDLI